MSFDHIRLLYVNVKCKSALTFYSCVQYLQLSKMVILDETVMVVYKIENVAPVIA